jgi:hypothetical protein
MLTRLVLKALTAAALAVAALTSVAVAQPVPLPPLSVVATGATQQNLPVAGRVFMYNEGPGEIFWLLGAPATLNSVPLPGGCGVTVDIGPNPTFVSAITAFATAVVLRLVTGPPPSLPGAFCAIQ